MQNRNCFYVVLLVIACLLYSPNANADEYIHEHRPTNPGDVILANYGWTHAIPDGFVPTSAEIEIRVRVWTFNDYGVLDLFSTDEQPFDYVNVLQAPNKPGFIRRLSTSTCPNQNTYYTIKTNLTATQLGWLGNDGRIYVALIGDRYDMYGWYAQYYLEYSKLTVIGTPGPPQIAIEPFEIVNSCVAGEDAETKTFEVWNSGSGEVNYSLGVEYSDPSALDWLSLSVIDGNSTGEHDQIDVDFLTADLDVGNYHAVISIASPDAGNSPQQIEVDLSVTAAPCGGDLDFDGDVDGSELAKAALGTVCSGDCRIEVFSQFGRVDCPSSGFIEDFDDGVADNWVDDGSGVWGVDSGEYKMSGIGASQPRYSFFNGTFDNFSYQVDVMRSAGSLNFAQSVIFRSDGSFQNGYVFSIGLNDEFLIYKRVDGTSIYMIPSWTTSSAINTGYYAWNTLKVECNGADMMFYINGALVKSLTDTQYGGGFVGLGAYDGSLVTDMHFDNVLLYK